MRRIAMVAAAATGLILTGCGGDDDSTSDAPDVAISEGKGGGTELFEKMTKAQLDAETATFDLSMNVEADDQEIDLLSATGASRTISETAADVTMDMSLGAQVGGAEMSFVVVDGVIYTNMLEAVGMTAETEWVSVDPANSDPASEFFNGVFGDQQAMADSSALLRENSELVEVEKGDRDEVDGVDATEYEVTVDVDDMIDVGLLSEAQLGMDPSALGFDSVTYSMWLDDDFLLRLMTTEMEVQGAKIMMEMNFTDWGEPVEIEAPAESEVTGIDKAAAAILGKDEVTEADLEQLESMFGM